MKTFFSESLTNYTSYTFNYAYYAVSENDSEIEEIYNMGFLPFTGRYDLVDPTFYMARSLRMNMSTLKETSENRRTVRKCEELNPEFEVVGKMSFDLKDPHFVKFCSDYAQERFKGGEMEAERLEYVLGLPVATHIGICKNGETDEILGYLILSCHGKSAHYWYAFLNLDLMYDYPIGKYLMWKAITDFNQNGYNYMYLGTCYGKHSLYKVRDHKGIEFWNGNSWNADRKKLKAMCKEDPAHQEMDSFKKAKDAQSYIENIIL